MPNSESAFRVSEGNQGVGVFTKDGKVVQKFSKDHADFILSSIPVLNQVSVANTEAPVAADGNAQGGGVDTITLATGASSVDGYYVGMRIYQQNENKLVISYNGTTKQATVESAWTTQPVNGTPYNIYLDCYWRELIKVHCTFFLPSQNGAFMKTNLFIKFFDAANRIMTVPKLIEPMSLLEPTYALTGNYLSPTPSILGSDGRAISKLIRIPTEGAKMFRIMLGGGVYQCNTFSAPANPNTMVLSGNVTVYTTVV